MAVGSHIRLSRGFLWHTKWTSAIAASIGLILLSGCGSGGSSGPALYPAKGSIVANGKPAIDALITLHPVDKSQKIHPSAQVDDEGNFKLTSFKPGDGAPAGDYKISVRWHQEPLSAKPGQQTGVITTMGGGEGESKAEPVDRLGGSYADPETSGLKCTITKGENEIPEINLDLNKARPTQIQRGA